MLTIQSEVWKILTTNSDYYLFIVRILKGNYNGMDGFSQIRAVIVRIYSEFTYAESKDSKNMSIFLH